MLKYRNGTIRKQVVPNETTLTITLSENEDTGQPLSENLQYILNDLKKHISCFCLVETNPNRPDQHELSQIFRKIKDAGLKTCFYSKFGSVSQIGEALKIVLDYLYLTDGHLYVKDLSPFDDVEEWYKCGTGHV